MAESTLTLGFSDLQAEIGDFLGYGRTTGNWVSAQTTHVAAVIDAGIRLFYNHPPVQGIDNHEWSFMYPVTTLALNAPYSTGTITYDHTGSANELEVTLASGTWPSWAASGVIDIAGSGVWDVATRTSGSIILLSSSSNPGADVAAGTSYELTQRDFTLPDNFGNLMGDMTYSVNDNRSTLKVKNVGEARVRELRQRPTGTTFPQYVAVRPRSSDLTTGQRFEAMFWPAPGGAYTLSYRYRVNPNKISSSAPYPLGGSDHAELYLEACLAKAELALDDAYGPHYQQFMSLLEAAVKRDMNRQEEYYGYNADNSDFGNQRFEGPLESRYVTYNGVRY